jgi:Skp family chaperone for outer membrane proteins
MIKGELDMDKKELTIEELEAKYKKISEEYKNIKEQLDEKIKEEKDRKKAELALEKKSRHKEIEEAAKHYCELVKAYQKDYGRYYYCAASNTYDNADIDIMSRLWNMIFGV